MSAQARLDYTKLDDLALAAHIAAGDPAAVRLLTQRFNQRLYRTAWSILKSRSEAEDAVQSTYLKAFAAIASFEGRSSMGTWLTRIAINEALGRARSAKRRRAALEASQVAMMEDYRSSAHDRSNSPEADFARAQVKEIVERAIARLPEDFRTAFILREIEQLSIEETASALGIPEVTVRTRHFRARKKLQQELTGEVRTALSDAFPFAGVDCAAMTERVVAAWCPAEGL